MSKQEHWTAEEYAEWNRLQCPAGWTPKREHVRDPDELERGKDREAHVIRKVAEAEGATPEQAARTVQRVTSGRCKRNIVRDPRWGNRALTGTEADWFDEHEWKFSHIDIHPTITLAGGIRYTADFLAWIFWKSITPPDEDQWTHALIDIKASEKHARATDIQRIAALCREHPLGPLLIVWREEGEWKELNDTTRPADARGEE